MVSVFPGESQEKSSETPPSRQVFLDAAAARTILGAAGGERAGAASVTVSLDLNLTLCEIEVLPSGFRHEGVLFPLGPLEAIARAGRKTFVLDVPPVEGGDPAHLGTWLPLEVFTGRYHQLVSTSRAPTLEIDGIQMHRTSGTDPFRSSHDAAASIVRPGDHVLDTCGGLGYTAIHAARLGAAEVISAEPSEGVLHLRRRNPWSRLAAGLPIRLEECDALALSRLLPLQSLDAIIHDPPRFALAPDLYSEAVYLRFRDLLRPGGRLFHYTGAPGSRGRGLDLPRRVWEKLRSVGFHVTPREDLQGFIGVVEPPPGRKR
ncbi:MAG TPA: hypothetical protein VMT52_12195 [Planctomycetota bacterium]|nr:hypothetical protein [Planctomycetota bacterium]